MKEYKIYEIKNGIVTKHIFDGVRRIVSKKGGNIFWYHTDHLGSTGFLTTEQDVNGDVQVIQKTTYFPFGETKEAPPVEEVQYKLPVRSMTRRQGCIITMPVIMTCGTGYIGLAKNNLSISKDIHGGGSKFEDDA